MYVTEKKKVLEIKERLSQHMETVYMSIAISLILFEDCCGRIVLDMLESVKRSDRADRQAGKAIVTSGLRLRKSEVLRSLRHRGHQAKVITPSIAWTREAQNEIALGIFHETFEKGHHHPDGKRSCS